MLANFYLVICIGAKLFPELKESSDLELAAAFPCSFPDGAIASLSSSSTPPQRCAGEGSACDHTRVNTHEHTGARGEARLRRTKHVCVAFQRFTFLNPGPGPRAQPDRPWGETGGRERGAEYGASGRFRNAPPTALEQRHTGGDVCAIFLGRYIKKYCG